MHNINGRLAYVCSSPVLVMTLLRLRKETACFHFCTLRTKAWRQNSQDFENTRHPGFHQSMRQRETQSTTCAYNQ
jgi:hypothetical protein